MSSSKFCPNDGNLLYYEDKDGKLVEMCRTCNFEREVKDGIISVKSYKEEAFDDPTTYMYFKYSPALARTVHVECPNKDCPSQKNKSLQESVFFTENKNMYLTHICVQCNAKWNYVSK